MAFIRAVLCLLFLSFSLFILAPIQMLAIWRHWPLQHIIQMSFSRTLCLILGIKVFVHGKKSGAEAQFIVSNHVSWTDILCLSSVHPVVFLAKSEVARWPLLGLFAKIQKTIFIPRHLKQNVSLINQQIIDVLHSGKSVVLFPEGTSGDGTHVLPFYASHFEPLSKIDNNIHITPITIVYRDQAGLIDLGWYGDMELLPHFILVLKKTDKQCHLFVGDQINVDGKDRKGLCRETEHAIRQMLSYARQS